MVRRRVSWAMAFALAACGSEDAPGSSGDGSDGIGATGSADAGAERWAQRRQLTLPEDVLGLGLTDVPVLVRVDASRISYEVTDQFTPDVRFYDGALETVLAHEVERWSPDGESLFWVRLPSIDDSEAGRSIYMYYGNSAIGDGSTPDEVWAEGYNAVWHMSPGPAGEVVDASGNGNVGTLFGGGAALFPSDIGGGALDISAGVSYLEVPHHQSLSAGDAMTIEGWVNPDGIDDRARFLVRKRDAYAIESVSEGDGLPRGVVWFMDSADRSVTASNPLESGWTHVAIVYDAAAADFSLFIDGALAESREPPSDPPASSDTALEIGLEAYGLIDEVRISSVARSAGFLAVQHRAMVDDLFTFGPPEMP